LRVFRIYPLATVVLLLILALVLIDRPFAARVAAGNIPPNLTLSSFIRTLLLATRWWTPVDGDWNQPVWSLSAEIMGYAVFPLLAFAAGRVTSRAGLLVLTLVCLAYPTGIAWMHGQLVNSDLFWGAGTRMAGAFTGGILLCRLHRLTPETQRRRQGAIADAGLVGLLVAQALPAGAILGIFCFGAIVYGLASNEGWTSRLCASRPAMLLGRISFPLYLVHVTVLSWLVFNVATYATPAWAAAIGLLLALLFCFCLSWLLHVGIEQPAHNFARSRARRPEVARAGSEAIAVATPSR
jgi:peptidoglycan/LPS O-acetylase OafA/YrhL